MEGRLAAFVVALHLLDGFVMVLLGGVVVQVLVRVRGFEHWLRLGGLKSALLLVLLWLFLLLALLLLQVALLLGELCAQLLELLGLLLLLLFELPLSGLFTQHF